MTASKPTLTGIEFHDAIAADWEQKYRKMSFQKRESVFAHALPLNDLLSKYWLDAGCGTGTLSALLASHGAQVFGVDGSAGMIEQAELACQQFSNASFQHIGNLEEWCWKGPPLDGILCSSVLEYLNDPADMLSKFNEWLNPGGWLLVSLPNRYSLLRNFQKAAFYISKLTTRNARPEYLNYSLHDASISNLRKMLANSGFHATRITPFGTPGRLPIPESRYVSPLLLAVAQKASSSSFT